MAILGNDAVLAAQPATAVQLSHACLQLGFEAAIPASWGDELVAAESVRQLATHSEGSAIFCACPYVESALLAQGPDLVPLLLPLAPPPIATARYLRQLYGDQPLRITYVGRCPSAATDTAIDVQLLPDDFLREMQERGVVLSEQPTVFDSVLPPDRRRYCSLPGGAPAPSCLWDGERTRTLIEIESEDYKAELAQQLIAHRRCVIDLAPRLGCACSGAAAPASHSSARAAVLATEPPRATGAVIEAPVELELSRHIMAHPAHSVPTVAAPPPRPATARGSAPPPPAPRSTPEPGRDTRREAHREPAGEGARAATRETPRESPRQSSPIHSTEPPATYTSAPRRAPAEPPTPPPGRARKTTPSGIFRVYTGHVPRTRGAEGQLLPRAYAAFRKPPVGSRSSVPFAPSTAPSTPVAVEPQRAPSVAETAAAEAIDSAPEVAAADVAAPDVAVPDVASADVAAADVAAAELVVAEDVGNGAAADAAEPQAEPQAEPTQTADDVEAADVAANGRLAPPSAELEGERGPIDDEAEIVHAGPAGAGASERAPDAVSSQALDAPDLQSAIAMARSTAIGVRDVPPAAETRPSALPLVAIALLALLTAAAVAIAVFLLRSSPAPERRATAATPLFAPGAIARPDSALAPPSPVPVTDSVTVVADSASPAAVDSAAAPTAVEGGASDSAAAPTARRTRVAPLPGSPSAPARSSVAAERAAPAPTIAPSEGTPTTAASSLGPSVFRVVPRPAALPARPAGSRLTVDERDSIQREMLRRRAHADSVRGATGDALAPRR